MTEHSLASRLEAVCVYVEWGGGGDGRAAVASAPNDAILNGLDHGTGKNAEEFLTMVLPDLGGREGRNFNF